MTKLLRRFHNDIFKSLWDAFGVVIFNALREKIGSDVVLNLPTETVAMKSK